MPFVRRARWWRCSTERVRDSCWSAITCVLSVAEWCIPSPASRDAGTELLRVLVFVRSFPMPIPVANANVNVNAQWSLASSTCVWCSTCTATSLSTRWPCRRLCETSPGVYDSCTVPLPPTPYFLASSRRRERVGLLCTYLFITVLYCKFRYCKTELSNTWAAALIWANSQFVLSLLYLKKLRWSWGITIWIDFINWAS